MGGKLKCPICERPLVPEKTQNLQKWHCPEATCGVKVFIPPNAKQAVHRDPIRPQ